MPMCHCKLRKCHLLLCSNVYISNIDISTPAAHNIPQIFPHIPIYEMCENVRCFRCKIIKSVARLRLCARTTCAVDGKFVFFLLPSDRKAGTSATTIPKTHESPSIIHLQPIKIQHENAFSLYCKKDPHECAHIWRAQNAYTHRPYTLFFRFGGDFFLLLKPVKLHKNGYNPLEWSSCDAIAYVRYKMRGSK